MGDPLNRRTAHEFERITSLDTHTRHHVLLLLGAHPELTITSGRRTPDRNRRAGGSPRSFHLQGRAADFTGPVRTLYQAATTARQQRVGRSCTGPEEVFVEDAGGPNQHLHVAW
jgi:uncharacterized protein YcbK (DUF882 family)